MAAVLLMALSWTGWNVVQRLGSRLARCAACAPACIQDHAHVDPSMRQRATAQAPWPARWANLAAISAGNFAAGRTLAHGWLGTKNAAGIALADGFDKPSERSRKSCVTVWNHGLA